MMLKRHPSKQSLHGCSPPVRRAERGRSAEIFANEQMKSSFATRFRARLSILTTRARETHRAGSSPRTTNNRMELMAVLRGLESIGEPARILIVTDSEYVSKGINEWLPVWREQRWRRGSGRRKKTIENLDLWQRLDEFLQRHQVTCEWVRSHCGHPENEECDRLARQAAEELNRELTRGGIAQCSDE
jgi:ribonuclease HI